MPAPRRGAACGGPGGRHGSDGAPPPAAARRAPPAVVNVKRIPELTEIHARADTIRIGALATLAALIEHPVIQAEYPVLPFTARYMGSPAIRHLATVGGNLCNASPAADLPPVLLTLDAGDRDRRPVRAAAAPARPLLPRPRPDGARAGGDPRVDRVPRRHARGGCCATSAWTSAARWTSPSRGWPSRSGATASVSPRRAWRSARWRRCRSACRRPRRRSWRAGFTRPRSSGPSS